jgi:hypothetical protein
MVRTTANTCRESVSIRDVKTTYQVTAIALKFMEDTYSVSTWCHTTQKEHEKCEYIYKKQLKISKNTNETKQIKTHSSEQYILSSLADRTRNISSLTLYGTVVIICTSSPACNVKQIFVFWTLCIIPLNIINRLNLVMETQ